jgi:EAL domain-containing protein (putative c-di-GMP-specific phosphodiesterase class I)
MADAAMYEAKRQAPGSYRFYSAEMNAEVSARFELTQDLRQALGNDELVLYYQPKVDAHDARLVGAEALVRWRSPTRGLVPPAHFVPLIDELGLGNWLGEWVMDRACAQMAAWDAAGLPPITVSVNLTPSHFSDSTLFEHIRATLSRHGLAPARLELEILEATAATDSPEILATLNNLRALGHHIALDDFGTGYSSLVYLTKLPANVLKLDRQFIVDLVTDRRQRAIVERIVALATVLGYRVIAEGVEDESQRGLLAAMGCDEIQGYLYSPPVPADRFAEMLRAGVFPQETSLTCT